MSEKRVIVVGAGLSGLCCARTLQRAGVDAQIYEASDGVGGRVRTDVVDGFQLDRGFQVMFTAYPAVRQELDLNALRLKAFDPGALVDWNGQRYVLGDPFRMPSQALASALSPLFGLGDKLNVAKLRTRLMGMTLDEIFTMPDTTMGEYLRAFGFSEAFLDRFIRPFYGGIFLERNLETSAAMFAFVFKMLSEGQTALPEAGLGAMGEQIAADLLPGTLRLNQRVVELLRNGERVTGIRLEDGRTIEAGSVIIATEADAAAHLTGLTLPTAARASTTLYFAVPEAFYKEKLIVLFTEPGTLVNNAQLITNVAPSYAPPGQHLLAATVLGESPLPDAELAARVSGEIAAHFPKANAADWRLLRIYRIRWAQFAQTSGIFTTLPKAHTDTPGLILAGEITASSSLHGALVAGQKAALLAMQ